MRNLIIFKTLLSLFFSIKIFGGSIELPTDSTSYDKMFCSLCCFESRNRPPSPVFFAQYKGPSTLKSNWGSTTENLEIDYLNTRNMSDSPILSATPHSSPNPKFATGSSLENEEDVRFTGKYFIRSYERPANLKPLIEIHFDKAKWEEIDRKIEDLPRLIYGATDNKQLSVKGKNKLLEEIKKMISDTKSLMSAFPENICPARIQADLYQLLNNPTRANLERLGRNHSS